MFRIALTLVFVAAVAVVATRVAGAPALWVVVTGAGVALLARTSPHTAMTGARRAPASQPSMPVESTLIGAIGEPVLLVVEGRVRVANVAAQALLGTHIVGEDVRLAIRHPAAAGRLAPAAGDGEVELVGLGGRDQRVAMRVSTIGPDRRVVHLIDRTTSHAAERARVDFVANASHELRTPLAAILGFIETLGDEAGQDSAVRTRFLSIMDKEARRMQRLIDDLISLSRIEAEKYQLPDAAVDLPGLIDEVAGELRDGRDTTRGPLVLAIEPGVPAVAGDRAQLSQVLHNLIGNAIKYGRQGQPVTVALHGDGAVVRLSVTDQGEGIASTHLPRLTERFYRVDSGRSRALGGTGLGLAIVKHIVERHRGRLDIASIIGTGTTVTVTLPLPAAPVPPTLASSVVTKTSLN